MTAGTAHADQVTQLSMLYIHAQVSTSLQNIYIIQYITVLKMIFVCKEINYNFQGKNECMGDHVEM